MHANRYAVPSATTNWYFVTAFVSLVCVSIGFSFDRFPPLHRSIGMRVRAKIQFCRVFHTHTHTTQRLTDLPRYGRGSFFVPSISNCYLYSSTWYPEKRFPHEATRCGMENEWKILTHYHRIGSIQGNAGQNGHLHFWQTYTFKMASNDRKTSKAMFDAHHALLMT